MSACEVSGTYTAYDWLTGIHEVQEVAAYEHGTDYYNGAANNVDFKYVGDKSGLSQKEQSELEETWINKLGKKQGVVFKVKTEGYKVITTGFEAVENHPLAENVRVKEYLKKYKEPAVLIRWNLMQANYVASGTIAEMKEKAHKMLCEHNFNICLYIVRRDGKVIVCTEEAKMYKTTTKKTNSKYLVLPVSTFRYVGWAPS